MATRKTQPAAEEVKEEAAEVQVEEVNTEETAAETNPWDETIEVFVPRARKGEDDSYYVCVNDRRYSVPKNGKTQKLPRPIGEVLQNGIQAEYRAQEFMESIRVNEAMNGTI